MQIISDVQEEFWWSVAEQCPYATFFHTPLWMKIACETNDDFENQTIGAEFSNGTRVVFPLLKTSDVYAFRILQSTYAGCYGGPIADGNLPEGEFNKFLDQFYNWRTGRISLLENPLVTDEYPTFDVLPKWNGEEYFTQIIELNSDYEDIYSNFSKDRRYGVRKARDSDISVRIASSLEDYESYFKAYQDSLERWDDVSSRYYWQLFRMIHKLSGEYSENIKLWVTEVDGQLATGALIFYWNDHVVNWHAASYSEYLNLYPNDLLHAKIIENSISSNYGYYDFNPSGGHEGVIEFKRGFGPDHWNINKLSFEGGVFEKAKRLKNQISSIPPIKIN